MNCAQLAEILDLFGEDSWRNVYAGQTRSAPTRCAHHTSGDHQGDGLFTQVLVSACEALSGGYAIFRARGSDLEQERR